MATTAAVAATAQMTMKQSSNRMGVVVGAGTLNRTAKVRVAKTVWNRRVQKTLIQHTDHIVHDPSNTARIGDIVAIESGFRASREKRHRLSAVISPNGPPMSERPAIPSRAQLILEAKKERAKSDRRLLGTADSVMRLHELRANKEIEDEVARGGDEAGVMSVEAQELRDLKARTELKNSIPRSINGVMMRLKETLKAQWREARAAMTAETADAVAEEMEKEAQRWFNRGIYWFADGLKPLNRGRWKKWREEMNWRGEFALTVSRILRSRAAEALAHKERVHVFADALGMETADAEKTMQKAETDAVISMAKWLKNIRGVYDAEIHALREEGGWLKSHGHLKKDAWRWEAHQIQLRERGALDTLDIVRELKAKGAKSLIWYRAVQEALAFEPKGETKKYVEPLRASFDARDRILAETKTHEDVVRGRKKELQEEMKTTNDFVRDSGQLAEITARDSGPKTPAEVQETVHDQGHGKVEGAEDLDTPQPYSRDTVEEHVDVVRDDEKPPSER